MAVAPVQGHHQRHRRPAVPVLGDVEGEAAPGLALVLGVQHAHPDLVVPQRPVPQPPQERVIVAALRLQEPAAHRLESRRQRIERFLHSREASQRSIETDGIVG